jgi:hypothetical protein
MWLIMPKIINDLVFSFQRLKTLLNKRKLSPEYTRRQWIFKCSQIFLCAIGMELSGLRIYAAEISVFSGHIAPAYAYNYMYVYYCAVHGLCMALALWRILEIYWWAKDRTERG